MGYLPYLGFAVVGLAWLLVPASRYFPLGSRKPGPIVEYVKRTD